MKCKPYVTIISIIVFIMLCLIVYSLVKNFIFCEKKLNINKINKPFQCISDNRLKNSILCNLAKRLRKKLKDLCDSDDIKGLKGNSSKYGFLRAKVGFEYVQKEMSDLISKTDNGCVIRQKVLLLKDFISQAEDSVFKHSKYQGILVKCELQNMVCMRFLLKSIVDLVQDAGNKENIELMRIYYVKLDAGLAFISTGLNLIVKNIEKSNKIDNGIDVDDFKLSYDEHEITCDKDVVTFYTIPLCDIENAIQ